MKALEYVVENINEDVENHCLGDDEDYDIFIDYLILWDNGTRKFYTRIINNLDNIDLNNLHPYLKQFEEEDKNKPHEDDLHKLTRFLLKESWDRENMVFIENLEDLIEEGYTLKDLEELEEDINKFNLEEIEIWFEFVLGIYREYKDRDYLIGVYYGLPTEISRN